jgi:hypothetical protein
MKYRILLLTIISYSSVFSQGVLIKKAKDYKDTIRVETLKPTFLFICPIDYVNTDSVYNSKLNSLIKSDKRIKSANIIVAFYKPLMAANKPHCLSINGFDGILELKGTLQCFALNFECGRIDSTLSRSNLKTKYWYKSYSLNTTEIMIYDNMCPQNLGERLYYYDDFMEELILPYYSEKEEIEFLKQKISNLEKRITDLEKLIIKTNENIQSNSQISNSESNPAEKSSNKEKKPRN